MQEDPEIEEFRKRERKNRILTGIAAAAIVTGITAGSAYACGRWNETRKNIITAIEQENAEEAARKEDEKRNSIEQIVLEAQTPEDAYLRIGMDIAFSPDNDKTLYSGDRWSSLAETYSTRTGDCEDGAIAFAAMLSNNPEYEVRLILLKRNPAIKIPGHMMAVYQERQLGTWGYVSFNEGTETGVGSAMENPLYGSIDSAVREYNNGSFVSYQIFDFSAEEMKFGMDLTGQFNESEAISLI